MKSVKFKKDFLYDELGLPQSAIEDRIVNHSRWSVHHEIIFEYQGKYYKTYYSVGATEYQDEWPWKYDDEVECVEVVQVEKTVKVWQPV